MQAGQPWRQVVYHIRPTAQDDTKKSLRMIMADFDFSLRPRRAHGKELGEQLTILGPHADYRGRPIIEAIMGRMGVIDRVIYTRRAVTGHPKNLLTPDGRIFFPPRRNRFVKLKPSST